MSVSVKLERNLFYLFIIVHLSPHRTVKAARAAPSTPTAPTLPLHPSQRSFPGIAGSQWSASPSERRNAAKGAWRTWWTHWNRRSLGSWQRRNKTVRESSGKVAHTRIVDHHTSKPVSIHVWEWQRWTMKHSVGFLEIKHVFSGVVS